MKEYRIELKVKNNLIYSKIEELGYLSIREFCLKEQIDYVTLLNLINMKLSPLESSGKFRTSVHKLCNALQCIPEELFTQTQIETELETNKITYKMAEAEVRFMLDNQIQSKCIEEIIHENRLPKVMLEALDTLTPREAKVIKLRFGLDGEEQRTLEEIGNIFDVNKERIRQIEAKALRKLRHPSRNIKLIDYLDNRKIPRIGLLNQTD